MVAGALLVATSLGLASCESAKDVASPPERVTVESTRTVTVTADNRDVPEKFSHYVALGDSYASMGTKSGDSYGPEFCARSKDNYPNQLADLYPGINKNRGFTDATCQGATTNDVINVRNVGDRGGDVDIDALADPQAASLEPKTSDGKDEDKGRSESEDLNDADPKTIAAEIEALQPDTDLITLSIGGNDVNFGPWSRCVAGALEGKGGDDCDEGLMDDTANAVMELPQRLDKVYEEIRKRAPNATIITTGYMPLASLTDQCPLTDKLPGGTLNWAAGLTVTMNAMARDAAARHGALFVVPDNAELHSLCAPTEERWTDPTGEKTDSYPAHPTRAGQKAMAEAIVEVLNAL
ncbi:Lipase 2 precursor [Corynebacterium aquatimens]|nr:Lipase 2 precursor [Corynebacterium aquatimens]